MRRHTRWMRRTALLACLVGLAVIGGGYVAMGAAGGEKTQNLTGKKPEAPRSEAKLPPLPKKLRARVVEPQAGEAADAKTTPGGAFPHTARPALSVLRSVREAVGAPLPAGAPARPCSPTPCAMRRITPRCSG